MTAKRLNFILVALLILIFAGAVGLTVYASVWLTKKSENIVALKLDSRAIKEETSAAIKAQSELEKYQDLKAIVDKVIPKSKDQAKALAELQKIASDLGLSINSIVFPSSELGTVAKPTTPATTDQSSSSQPSSSTPAKTTSSVTQAKPVEGLSGILGMDVTISGIDRLGLPTGYGVSYSQLLQFLEGVEKNRRTMQIKSIQIIPVKSQSGSSITGYALSLTLTIYIKP